MMFRIVKADLYRLIHESTVKVMVIVCLVYIGIMLALVPALSSINVPGVEVPSYTGDKAFVSIDIISLFSFFIPFLVVSLISSEFSKKTIRNVVATRIDRMNIFTGKYISFCIIVIALMLFAAITSTAIYSILFGWKGENILSSIGTIAFTVIKMSIFYIADAGLTIILALLIHNSAAVVLLYFAIDMAEAIASALCLTLSNKISTFGHIAYAFPSTYSNGLIGASIKEPLFINALISMACYITLTLLIGNLIFDKKDIA